MLPSCSVEYILQGWPSLNRPKSYRTSYFLFDLPKGLLLLKATFKMVLLLGHSIGGPRKLTIMWNMHSPKPQAAYESLCFHLLSWQRHSCYLVNHIHRHMTAAILPFDAQELDVLCRSPDLAFLYGKPSFQNILNYSFFPSQTLLLPHCPTQ